MPLTRFVHAVRSSLWLVPLLCVLAGVLVVLCTLWLDRRSGYTLVPLSVTGTPSDAQTTLSVFATAMASLTSLVLTVTLVVVQLAMGQFSPRIVGALLSDRFSQLAIGLFGATFVVAVLTLREIRGSDTGTVPGVSMLLSHLLMAASLVTLVLFVHHSGQTMRASGLIDLVGDRTRDLITSSSSASPGPATGPDADGNVVPAREPGNIVRVDRAGLVAAARRADCVLELVPVVGDFVPGGAPLFRVHPGPGQAQDVAGPVSLLRAEDIARLVLVGPERVHAEDPSYGLRKLVDIAERSIAQPFDDPTTTLQSLHRLHDLLRQLAVRPLPPGEHRDPDGVVRLVERTLSWEGYVRLAFDEIRLAGTTSPQVTRRLCAALHDLKGVAPPDRQAPLDRQLRLLTAAVHRAYDDEEDVTAALTPDAEGIGSGADVTTAVRLGTSAGVRLGARVPG
ncbi:conserved membrane protein of unknown function [Modestobacter italicus]|uniref:DUF2254 domain-containing protein n=1 Tax=Modestobacter italicus (strain DSM 44449 / CECT 9708 / BC 501) TaxID=2732864 RepID=I4EVN5_MODI5|nr:DUF2254 domain-containing protein [Modestobacter marinus]CCH87448.1 conserved membrane protein of unknown function [Modestobacter marinus]